MRNNYRYHKAQAFALVAFIGLWPRLSLSEAEALPTKKEQAPAKAAAPKAQLGSGDVTVNRPVKDKWALVIGISKYANPAINLKYPSKDAKDIYNYLVNSAHFAPDHVRLLVDDQATREHILSAIGDKWLPHAAGPDDLVVIYFSSHGSPADIDVGGINYLVAYDTDVNSLYATGIPIQDLTRTIKARVHADRVVIILDACHSGSASAEAKGLVRTSNVDAADIAQGTGQLVIASSKPDQVSWEGRTYQNSVFTRSLIEALQSKGEKTTLGDAFDYMQEKVQDEVLRDRGVLQTPVMKSQWKGTGLELAITPSKPRPGLPDEVITTTTTATTTATITSTITTTQSITKDTAGSTASMTSPQNQSNRPILSAPPKTVLNNGNIYAVENRPTQSTKFSLDSPARLVYLFTYHWNYGQGKPAGTVSLQHEDGTVYGPFETVGKPGQGGVPSAYWECEPNTNLKAGTYKLIDSDPATWSQNAGTNGQGIAKVKIVPLPATTAARSTNLKREPIVSLLNNGNIYRVFNKPSNMTSLTIKVPTLITNIMDYHWNDGRGQDPGTISLVHQDGTLYGPFQTHGALGQGGVPNASWLCEPNVLVKPGSYAVIDSDVDTWAQNDLSGCCGITEVKGVPQQ